MNSTAVSEIDTWMATFRDTRAVIVDVRGNGGGSREALRALFPYVMTPAARPEVVSTAKYRLHPDYPDDHMGGSRFMFRESWSGWTPEEREAIARFKPTFTPEWAPPAAEFSEWHYLVMSRSTNPKAFAYGKPVVILMDEKCFSATDIFLSAFKGYPGVRLVGSASGGGSALQIPYRMPVSGLSMTLASMASFQRGGQLYDTRGVQPDVAIDPAPEFYIKGGRDLVLERALDLVK
jgi:C-terminal processing protease CtpA/Prc